MYESVPRASYFVRDPDGDAIRVNSDLDDEDRQAVRRACTEAVEELRDAGELLNLNSCNPALRDSTVSFLKETLHRLLERDHCPGFFDRYEDSRQALLEVEEILTDAVHEAYLAYET